MFAELSQLNQHLDVDALAAAQGFGFRPTGTGGHMARSMMLQEIRALVSSVPASASREQYRSAILEENVLGKPTFSSREKSYRHLMELYGLDPMLALFRVFRELLRRILTIAKDAEVVRDDLDVEATVTLFEAIFFGLEAQLAIAPELVDFDAVAKTWADLLERFLRGDTEGDVEALEARVGRVLQDLREGGEPAAD